MNKDFDQYLNKITKDAPPANKDEIESTWQKVQQKQQQQSHQKMPKKKGSGKIAVLIAACLLLFLGAAALLPDSYGDNTDLQQPFSSDLVYAASNYDEIYQALIQTSLGDSSFTEESINEDTSSSPTANISNSDNVNTPQSSAAFDSAETENYSQTNTQVAGIDEGDIVKTDGQNIYLLRDNELIISSANGADSAILSQTKILPDFDELAADESYQFASEIYVYDNYLAVITSKAQLMICSYPSATSNSDANGAAVKTDAVADYWQGSTEVTSILIYDISDPTSPQLLNSVGQDGYYTSSRLIDNTLYLISQYSVYSGIDSEQPATFVPGIYQNEERTIINADAICLLPEAESSTYTIISAIDLTSQTIEDTISVLGGGDTIYMNHDNLYIARSYYETAESSPYTEDQYTVVAYEEQSVTDIMRFSLSDGSISLVAAGQIEGWLDSQFALDEYNGYLRAVTTVNNNNYKIYTDEARGWQNYQWDDAANSTTSALWILDEELKLASSIEDLAPGEQVYSVRFTGNVGYFVTFRQVDPLFTVDLSDPYAPQMLSELKIPGFSEYLHPYSDGRLLGLGQDADEQTGVTGNLKLTMFDTSDPVNVTEKHTLILDSQYSQALYNHKAILVSAAHDLIAFPTENNQYEVYGYDDTQGFYKRGSFSTDEENWYNEARGLFVDDSIYICLFNSITIVDINNLSHLATLHF